MLPTRLRYYSIQREGSQVPVADVTCNPLLSALWGVFCIIFQGHFHSFAQFYPVLHNNIPQKQKAKIREWQALHIPKKQFGQFQVYMTFKSHLKLTFCIQATLYFRKFKIKYRVNDTRLFNSAKSIWSDLLNTFICIQLVKINLPLPPIAFWKNTLIWYFSLDFDSTKRTQELKCQQIMWTRWNSSTFTDWNSWTHSRTSFPAF